MDTEGREEDEAEGNRGRVREGDHKEDCSRKEKRWTGEETRGICGQYAEDCTT